MSMLLIYKEYFLSFQAYACMYVYVHICIFVYIDNTIFLKASSMNID